MTDDFTIRLTRAELVALHRASAFFADAFEHAGIDLAHVEMPNGTLGVSPLVIAVAKLEVELLASGADI